MTLLLGVLVASLLGSVHCAAMCGPFACVYAVGGGRAGNVGAGSHVAYHVGRLVSYSMLGALAGAIGGGVESMAALRGVGRGAAVVAGALMLLWAIATIATSAGVRVPMSLAPTWAKRMLGSMLARAQSWPPVGRATVTGLLTTLLPCGWLYTFVVAAGGTGSVGAGTLTMIFFWAGTVPALLAVGVGVQRAFAPVMRQLPILSASLVLVLALLTIAGRMRAPLAHAHMPAEAHAIDTGHVSR